MCVTSSPEEFGEFGLAAVEPLFEAIGEEDPSSLGEYQRLARDNVVGASQSIVISIRGMLLFTDPAIAPH